MYSEVTVLHFVEAMYAEHEMVCSGMLAPDRAEATLTYARGANGVANVAQARSSFKSAGSRILLKVNNVCLSNDIMFSLKGRYMRCSCM